MHNLALFSLETRLQKEKKSKLRLLLKLRIETNHEYVFIKMKEKYRYSCLNASKLRMKLYTATCQFYRKFSNFNITTHGHLHPIRSCVYLKKCETFKVLCLHNNFALNSKGQITQQQKQTHWPSFTQIVGK